MSRARLDPRLIEKIAAKTAKSAKYVREQISKRAAREGTISEVALLRWAGELGIGTAALRRGLDPHIQQQVSIGSTSSGSSRDVRRYSDRTERATERTISPLRATIDFLLGDPELKSRCADLLMARKSFDRVFREATVVLDDRLKRLCQIKGKLNPAELVARALHPTKAILIVSEHADEQKGFFELFTGLMAAFRNPSHHSINDKLSREDALRFCGFVDSLLALLEKATVKLPA